MQGLRIVFFGTPQFAVPTLRHLLASHHTVCGVVTQPDRPRGRGQKVADAPVKALAVEQQLPLIQPERLRDSAVDAAIRQWKPDLGVVAAYGKIIPDALLAIPRLGMINVHASLLPKYRGAAPVHRAVIEGEAETGVTIMRVAKVLDSGNMFAKVKRPIGPGDTSDEIERDLSELGAQLLVQVVNDFAAGTAHEEPQDERLTTYAPRLTKEEGRIDWTLPASSIHNRVRGLHPWPHAYAYIDGERLILLKTHVPSEAGRATVEPGTIVKASGDDLHVAAGHGTLVAIDELQAEGRRPMRAREFLAGRRIAPGQRLS